MNMDSTQDPVPENINQILAELKNCRICPHACNADRFDGKLGFCNSDAGFNISSVCRHMGEEPVISGKYGICNLFFSRCNMACVYCQNFQISRRDGIIYESRYTLQELVREIIPLLDSGIRSVGFVSPSHYALHCLAIIEALGREGYNPNFVYNSNGYDSPDTLRRMEGKIDVYLPDFKYMDDELAYRYSGVKNYGVKAGEAIREMYRQKGSTLITDNYGYAQSGLVIRHLVLPGHPVNSVNVLRYIADHISANISISLMAQYNPTCNVMNDPGLGRRIYAEEYQVVVDELHNLGFHKGWIQEPDSPSHYNPDFGKEHPFEG